MKRIIRCSECGYCREFRPVRNTRSSFTCEHPDGDYIQRNGSEAGSSEGCGGAGEADRG